MEGDRHLVLAQYGLLRLLRLAELRRSILLRMHNRPMRRFGIVSAQHAAAETAEETGPLLHLMYHWEHSCGSYKDVLSGHTDPKVDHLAEQVCFP